MEGTQESAIEFIELYKRKEIIRAFATIASRRNRILRALHIGVRSLSGSPSDVFAASSGFVHLYTLRFREREKIAALVAKATVHKEGSVQRSSLLAVLNFQPDSGLYKNFTRMSTSEFEFLINLIGKKKSRERTQRSGKSFLFKKGWH